MENASNFGKSSHTLTLVGRLGLSMNAEVVDAEAVALFTAEAHNRDDGCPFGVRIGPISFRLRPPGGRECQLDQREGFSSLAM